MNKKLIGILKLVVSVGLIAYLFSIVDFSVAFERYKTIHPGYLLIAFALLVTQVAVSALKWKLILQSDGIDMPYLPLLKAYYIGNFLSLFLPSSFGGDIYRVYALSSQNQGLGKTTSSVLFDRLSGLLALLTIALFAFVSLPGSRYDIALIACYIAGILTFVWLTSERAVATLRGSPNKLVSKASVLLASFRAYRTDIATLWKVLAISLLFQLTVVVINKIYAMSLDIGISFSELLVIVPLVYLTEVLPISINGIGVRDSAFVFFYSTLGYAKEEGLAVALLVLGMRYVSGLVGGLVLLASVVRQHFLARNPAASR